MPEDIAREILDNFKKLDARFVAVRSSATAEDSASAAWAGQLDSFLNTTEESLLKNVQRCWASLFTPRAIFYRFEQGLHESKISVAVVVQKMIQSEVSGIAFSVHPVTEDYNQLIIEAGFGLGEAIVSGQITPDSYVVEKSPRRIIDKNIAEQERGIYRKAVGAPARITSVSDVGGNEWQPIPTEKRNLQKLSNDQILELSAIIIGIEKHYGFPCDIEWAFEGGKFYIVQSRPITTLSSCASDYDVDNGDLVEVDANNGVVRILNRAHESKDIFKDREEYIGLGRWVVPVIESEEWLDWCNTDDAIEGFDLAHNNPAAVVVDGYFFLPKDGSYTELREQIRKEFESGNFNITTKILNLARAISDECIDMANRLKRNPTFEDFITAFNLMARLRFPWMACFPIGDAGEEFVNQYAAMHNIRVDEVGEMIPQLPNSLTDDQNELSKFKEQIEKEGLPFDVTSIEDKNPLLAEKIKEYQKKTEYIGTHHFWGDERNIDRLMDAIKNASPEHGKERYLKSPTKALDIIAETTRWRLECAQSSAFLAYAFRPYMTTLAEQHNITYDDLIYLSILEIKELIGGGKDMLPLIQERKKAVGMLKIDGDIHIVVNEELCDWQKHFDLLDVHENIKEFRGSIGNKGVVRGIVAIVLKPTDQPKILPGMILVAPETTPDFIPCMGKAIAFVTDQGG
ncbi:MAG: PEP/pyruvate-binding domain-containing protein, partial [Candidatus Moraniibacteriota bacterium]